MSENVHGPGPDDTTRLPHEHTHRYADQPGYTPGYQQAYPAPGPPSGPSQRRNRPGGGAIAAILVAALVVGGISGVAGAAGFTAVDHVVRGDDTSTSSGTPSSSVVDHHDDTAAAPDSAEGVAQRLLPSVVKINVTSAQGQGSGSGIVIGSDGEILTNNHVVALAGQGGNLSVNFNDGSAKPATVVGTDPLTDLAVIKARGVSGLSPAAIGSSDDVQVGENVVAIGSPFGLQATVTSGIVSAMNRPVSVGSETGQGQDTTYPAIQTDAAINPGNSGGPLVDMNGDVIGINSSIRTASSGVASEGGSIGLGFAIPISKVWPVVQQLRKGETPTHARMGVQVTDASSNNGLLTGAGIQSVTNGSAADKAGLERGDVVTKVGDEVVTGADALVATIRGHRPGDTVTLTVVSGGGDKHTVKVTLESDGGSASS